MKIKTNWILSLLMVAFMGFGVTACDVDEGPMEETGEEIDEGFEETEDELEEFGDEMDTN